MLMSMFKMMFPTETSGDGRIRPPYVRRHLEQGPNAQRRRVSCGVCGFPGVNLDRHDHSGGDLSGNGAGGSISSLDQSYRAGAGCPLCFSKNYFNTNRRDEFAERKSYESSLAGA